MLGGGFNVAPQDVDVCVYRLHHPEPSRYAWWDYRAGNFHKNIARRGERAG